MGSVYQRKSDGRWVAAENIDGRRIVRYAKSEREAVRVLAALQAQAALGQAPPVAKTIKEMLERWLATEQVRWKPSTEHLYRRIVYKVIVPDLGRVRLGRLATDRLQRFFDRLTEHPKQAHNTFRLMHRAFTVAVRWGWLPSNPCDRITPPAYKAPKPTLPSPAELAQLIDATRDDRWWPWLVVALHTGLRPGEQAAIRWTDVDWDDGNLHIERAVQLLDGEWVETSPKTESGRRVIGLTPQALTALRKQRAHVAELRLKAGPIWKDRDLVFPGRRGQPLGHATINRAIGRLCRRQNVSRVTPHELRHLHASLLLSERVPLPDVSRRLGHANTHITAAVYAHALGSDDRSVRAIERALG